MMPIRAHSAEALQPSILDNSTGVHQPTTVVGYPDSGVIDM